MLRPVALEMASWADWAIPLGVGLFFLPLGYLLRTWVFRYAQQLARRTPWPVDDVILQTMERHLFLWVLLAAAFTSVQVSELSSDAQSAVNKALGGIFVVSLTVLAIDLFNKFVRLLSRQLNLSLPIAPALHYTVTSLILFLGALFLLSAVGVTTTPLLVLIGVIVLAGAISLRNALPEVFEGLALLAARHLQPGDYISLESGEEGEILEIGWRLTKLRTPRGELVMLPNSKLSRSVIKQTRREKLIARLEARDPFLFSSTVALPRLTGFQARTLQELLELLRQVPTSVLYYHSMHFVREHEFLLPQPSSDFAHWIKEVLDYQELGEVLSTVDPCQFTSLEELRAKLITVIEEFLKSQPDGRRAPPGQEFHFMSAVYYILPTQYRASTLKDLMQALEKVQLESIYWHLFESKLRAGKPANDFSQWVEGQFGLHDLARKIGQLEPYSSSGEGLRQELISLVREETTE